MLVAELRNDHKDVTNKIDKNLEILHSAKLSKNEQSTSRRSGKYRNSILSNDNVINGSMPQSVESLSNLIFLNTKNLD
jgi:hypothetical protein